jgi:hypothetical protein
VARVAHAPSLKSSSPLPPLQAQVNIPRTCDVASVPIALDTGSNINFAPAQFFTKYKIPIAPLPETRVTLASDEIIPVSTGSNLLMRLTPDGPQLSVPVYLLGTQDNPLTIGTDYRNGYSFSDAHGLVAKPPDWRELFPQPPAPDPTPT